MPSTNDQDPNTLPPLTNHEQALLFQKIRERLTPELKAFAENLTRQLINERLPR